MLTLTEAIKTGRLRQFVLQEEKRGIGPADRKRLEELLRKTATKTQSKGRTSRSASRDGSSGK